MALLIDEPHHIVSVLACRQCGQHFVSVFSETIDWMDGEDPQHWTLMPLSAEEAERLIQHGALLSPADLAALPTRRTVLVDHPKGTGLIMKWGLGIGSIEHD